MQAFPHVSERRGEVGRGGVGRGEERRGSVAQPPAAKAASVTLTIPLMSTRGAAPRLVVPPCMSQGCISTTSPVTPHTWCTSAAVSLPCISYSSRSWAADRRAAASRYDHALSSWWVTPRAPASLRAACTHRCEPRISAVPPQPLSQSEPSTSTTQPWYGWPATVRAQSVSNPGPMSMCHPCHR